MAKIISTATPCTVCGTVLVAGSTAEYSRALRTWSHTSNDRATGGCVAQAFADATPTTLAPTHRQIEYALDLIAADPSNQRYTETELRGLSRERLSAVISIMLAN